MDDAELDLSLLRAAADSGTSAFADFLIRGANISARDDNGWMPLHLAAERNTKPVAALLLNQGADTRATDDKGWTPLHLAGAFNASLAVAAFLLDHGADIAARTNNGSTPPHLAAENNAESAVVALLLARGADTTVLDEDGETPHHFVANPGGAAFIRQVWPQLALLLVYFALVYLLRVRQPAPQQESA